ncbi:MAG: hypothetical protein LBP59_10365 [Planctomycetaceae bacterium]|jgi:hypothetical protein|nr:hypothetical protein [Planctomycetaceae bacterium]
MVRFGNMLTTVLSVVGNYGDGNQAPLRVAVDRMFEFKGDVMSSARTVTLPVSSFSKEYPLLPQGWNGGAVWVVIANNTGKMRPVYLTNQEQAAELAADVVIGSELCNEVLRVRSGCIAAFEPAGSEQLYLYAPKAIANIRITYFPIR